MTNTTFREYKFKFYLNANHFIVINGKEGEVHPHTWEFMVDVLMSDQEIRTVRCLRKGNRRIF